jgi:hypothetical protein
MNVYRGQGFATAGMVLGIVAWALSTVLLIFLPVSVILGLIGLPLSIVGMVQLVKQNAPHANAVAGILLNAGGLVLAVLFVTAAIAEVAK